MNKTHQLELPGCTPEPLMSYLKALGILRIVSEQVDSTARGRWQNDVFVLESSLEEDSLMTFFLHRYSPTPLIGPWAGGSGFFGNDNRTAIEAICQSPSERFARYREVIRQAKRIVEEEGIADKPSDKVKEQLLRRYRREMPDGFVQWMDAAMVLHAEGQAFTPLLGTGGNDGRLDFTQNFMKRLADLALFSTHLPENNQRLLRHAFLGKAIKGLGKSAVGQFSPGRSGGPNATQGMEGDPTDNPWEFVLMLEGALMLAGALVRRLGQDSTDKAAFPFTVRPRPVGGASPAGDEMNNARGEMWLPIWERFASRAELETLFAEGRVDLAGKPARDTVGFARSIAALGVDRGIASFARYGFLRRSGKAYLAASMDRFAVPDEPRRSVDLLDEVDLWLDSYRRMCSAQDIPVRFQTGLGQIESAIYVYCRMGRPEAIQEILVALGRAERELAVTAGRRGSREACPPLGRLSLRWAVATHDGSSEYDIALALTSIQEQGIEPIRANLEPVTFSRYRWSWVESGPHVVWNSADLATNMAAVLERRIMEGAGPGREGLALASRRRVSLPHVAQFLAEGVDDRRIEDLLWGLILLDHRQAYPEGLPRFPVENAPPLPRAYALLKLLFLPRPLTCEQGTRQGHCRWRLARNGEEGVAIRPEPRILPLLRARRLADACRIAHQRLQVSGLNPMPSPRASGAGRANDWESIPALDSHRLAAALLIPISNAALNQIVEMVTRRDEQTESQIEELLTSEGEDES
jgi:CRISPR-associated protein Csx17